MKDNKLYEKNLKVLIEVSRKIKKRKFKSMNEVEMWVWSHPDYTPTDHDISYGIAHLRTIRHLFQ